MYTMNKSHEQADTAGPYKKSLLYLVSRAFETAQPTGILGLEESLRDDLKLIRYFGLAGNQKRADVLFSKTGPEAPLHSRTLSTSHGGFDDDVATMSSMMRRVLGVPDSTAIVDFFQEPLAPRGRAGSGAPQAAPEQPPLRVGATAAVQPAGEPRRETCAWAPVGHCASASTSTMRRTSWGAASTTRAAGRPPWRSAASRSLAARRAGDPPGDPRGAHRDGRGGAARRRRRVPVRGPRDTGGRRGRRRNGRSPRRGVLPCGFPDRPVRHRR